MTNETTELADRWILPLRGSRVTGIDCGQHVTFELEPPGRIGVGHGALFTDRPITAPGVEPVPLAQHSDDAIQHVLGASVVSAVAFKTGALRVVFDNGWNLNVKSAEPFVPASITSGDTVIWTRPTPASHG